MTEHRELTRPTSTELENARTKGQVIGWVQGAGGVILFGLVLRLVGWIPLLALAGIVGYIGYRMVSGKGNG